MTGALSSHFLRERILASLQRPLTTLGIEALDSFLSLPFVEDWSPENMYLSEVSSVFDIGLPFSLLAGNATAEAHRRQIGLATGKGGRAPASLISEVHAGALLSKWGANVKFVPRQAHSTPDIEATWDDGLTLDVEVARGETRQLHKAVQDGLEAFTGALQPGDVAWNVVGFIADASNPGDLAAMFEAGHALCPGQIAESTGRWYVQAVPLARRDELVGAHSTELFGPNWWPSDEPSYFSTSTLLGAIGNPVVFLRSLVPLASYMNPILRKATGGQRHPGNPFLIAVDVSELPRAHERIANDLIEYFKIWDHVTAVLLFEPRFYIGVKRKEWVVSIHPNPSATIGLPLPFAELSEQGRFSMQFTLSEGQG